MCHVCRGMAMIVSPALPTMDLECSEDFEECTVLEQMNLVAEGMAPFFSQLMPIINQSVPSIQLEEATAADFLDVAGRIAEREKLEPESSVLRHMNERLTSLMRWELILGVVY
ncbi:MAG: hypothetical protein J6Y45_05730, partial [Bacteroidales bacterium]|nr:hypothetical protein [Bacteroidales bacterium]